MTRTATSTVARAGTAALTFLALVAPPAALGQSEPANRGVRVVPATPPAPAPAARPPGSLPPAGPAPLPEELGDPNALGIDAGARTRDVAVSGIEVVGNTRLPAAAVETVLVRYRGRILSFEELESLRRELTLLYVVRGHVNSGMVLKSPVLDGDGVLRLRAVEGSIERLSITGNRALRTSYIAERIRDQMGPVFNVNEVEAALRQMQQWPLMRQVNAEVRPGSTLGAGELDVAVRENDPMTFTLGGNNHRSPSVGETEGTIGLMHRSLTGNGDVLSVNVGVARGLDAGAVGYSLPLNSRDLTLEANYARGKSDIIEAPFTTLDIVSKTETTGLRLTRPFARTLNQVTSVGLSLEHKTSRSSLLGAPFSFAPGETDGRAAVTAVRLTVDWSRRYASDAVALRGALSQGVRWFGATDNSRSQTELPDGRFRSLLLQMQYAHHFDWRRTQALARLTVQRASDPLLSVEKLAIGGASTVRGYRENLLVRDEGEIASVELRLPVFVDRNGAPLFGLTLAPFVDYGRGRDRLPSLPSATSRELVSVGAGVIWEPWAFAHMAVYYGSRKKEDAKLGDSLQDRGIHLMLAANWSF